MTGNLFQDPDRDPFAQRIANASPRLAWYDPLIVRQKRDLSKIVMQPNETAFDPNRQARLETIFQPRLLSNSAK